MLFEPFRRPCLASSKRRFLHGLDSHQFALGSLQLGLGGVERGRAFALGFAQRLQRRERRLELLLRLANAIARLLLRGDKFVGPRAGHAVFELGPLLLQALALRPEPQNACLDLLDSRLLDLGVAHGVSRFAAELFPALLPVRQRSFGGSQDRASRSLLLLGGIELRLGLRKKSAQLAELFLVASDQHARFRVLRLHALQVDALALAQLPRMLQGLLGSRRVGTRLVVPPLHGGKGVSALHVPGSRPLDHRFRGAQFRDGGLGLGLALACERMPARDVAVEVPHPQCQQLRLQLALAAHVLLVAAGNAGLALQMADLLVDFLAKVIQPLEVLTRVRDAVFGLPAAILVARDTRRFFDEGAHVLGPRFDQSRNHALLDDRVAARTEPGAEKQVRDVLAAALGAVDEVGRVAVPRHEALQRDFGIAGIGSRELAVAVVEDQLDRAAANRLAAARAIEDHVGHRVAAQVLRGNLAHHPADRVDDVRLAAAIRADDASQVAGKRDGGGIDERLETGEFYPGKAHSR